MKYLDIHDKELQISSGHIKKRFLLIADVSHPSVTVQNHIKSLYKNSKHKVIALSPTHANWCLRLFKFFFDGILIHYSVPPIFPGYISDGLRKQITKFEGFKGLILEDEYRYIDRYIDLINKWGFNLVLSSLDSVKNLKIVYTEKRFSHELTFARALPGYISPKELDLSPSKIKSRNWDVVYRGRELPLILGSFSQEKRIIGEVFEKYAKTFGLRIDISSKENERIYGQNWYRFLMSSKATLGTEGGATIFDFDGFLADNFEFFEKGELSEYARKKFSSRLAELEGNVVYKTLTPKIFQAILCKTALILFPGNYNKILIPNKHYIPLAKDFSNIKEVMSLIKDNDYLQSIVDRAYEDIALNKEFHDTNYSKMLDQLLSESFRFAQ